MWTFSNKHSHSYKLQFHRWIEYFIFIIQQIQTHHTAKYILYLFNRYYYYFFFKQFIIGHKFAQFPHHTPIFPLRVLLHLPERQSPVDSYHKLIKFNIHLCIYTWHRYQQRTIDFLRSFLNNKIFSDLVLKYHTFLRYTEITRVKTLEFNG